MDKITHEMRLMQWTQIIRECRKSGLTIKSWCLENNINEKRFYYWQRRVREEAYDALEKTESNKQQNFVQLPVPANISRNTPSFMADMIIHIGNNVLELSNTVSEELLSKVFKVMNDVK
ncbi:IS66 family insertion sequence element accessory protein TnpB [Clostridiaceae bacterium 35-E11]